MKWFYALFILSFSCETRTQNGTTNIDYYDDDDNNDGGITTEHPINVYRRQFIVTLTLTTDNQNTRPSLGPDSEEGSAVLTKRTRYRTLRFSRTTPFRLSFTEDCDYLAYYCMKAYQTGKVCGRTYYYMYHDFANYCMLDYVNCMERQEVWQITHMGECFQIKPLDIYKHYPYENDYFLDQYYLLEDQV